MEHLDLEVRDLRTDDGTRLDFDVAVLATGARARPLPVRGADLAGVLTLRDTRDAEALKNVLVPGRRLAVVGGGYVGLEAAASAQTLGARAVVIEREARLLARVAGPELSAFFEGKHRDHGALLCDDGVVVDLNARTSDPRVFAIGDVTRRPLPHYGRLHRLESVPNALEQARQAAAAITGRPLPPAKALWFWSDKFDVKLQIAGLPFECDRRVVRSDPPAGASPCSTCTGAASGRWRP